MLDLSVVILTHNEEIHLERAICSVRAFARDIIVVDSFSSDATVAIAERLGATVYQHPFVNQAKQFQWALDTLGINTEWIMRLDADEIVEADLATALTAALPAMPADVTGIHLKRKQIFMGRWIRYGGRYPLLMMRIWRRGKGRIEDRWMDEHALVWGGRTVVIDGGFTDHNLNGLSYFTAKHNAYATREALEVLMQKRGLAPEDGRRGSVLNSGQARGKRFIKESLYNRLPFPLMSLLYFLFRYVVQGGFLDGIEGACYHFLQGFWYRFLVGAKLLELQRATAHLDDPAAIKTELAKLTGLKID